MNSTNAPAPREPGIFRRLYRLILPYRRTVAVGMFCLLLAVAAELYPPLIWQRVVDVGLAPGDWTYILGQLALLVVVFGVGQICSAIRSAEGDQTIEHETA
jgi:ABC-type multidrug transport system fused ATPase/permease subunit